MNRRPVDLSAEVVNAASTWIQERQARGAEPISQDEKIFRDRLLIDQRMKNVWALFTAEGDSKRRQENLGEFIDVAPASLREGTRLQHENVDPGPSVELRDLQKLLKSFRKRLLLIVA